MLAVVILLIIVLLPALLVGFVTIANGVIDKLPTYDEKRLKEMYRVIDDWEEER